MLTLIINFFSPVQQVKNHSSVTYVENIFHRYEMFLRVHCILDTVELDVSCQNYPSFRNYLFILKTNSFTVASEVCEFSIICKGFPIKRIPER